MVKISYGQIRWVGWATLCAFENPEIGRLQDWIRYPEQLAVQIVLYFFLGLVLEFTYRKLAWGSIFPQDETAEVQPIRSSRDEWHTFKELDPPYAQWVEVLCADGQIRKGIALATSLSGRLIFEIEYEMEIRQQQQAEPMKFAPQYWRFSDDVKGDKNDVF